MSVRSEVTSGLNPHWEWRLEAGAAEDGKTMSIRSLDAAPVPQTHD